MTETLADFDFVIVGAGSAGCVIANRLSGLPQAPSVCLIERGPADTDSRWNVALPAAWRYNAANNFQSDLWLQSFSEPERQLIGRRLKCQRGTGWGGTSAISALGFVRGQPEDFDRWAKDDFCGDLWSFKQCLPYFKRLESYSSGIEAEDTIDYAEDIGYLNTIEQYRGFEGPMTVTSGRLLNRKYSKCPYFPEFLRAATQAGYKYNPDCNGVQQEGVSWLDSNISQNDGLRQSTSRCYLLPILSRKNLTVVSNALVSRIILEDKRAVGVQYTDSKGIECIVKARQEVILSAGALNSPQILMLSGIGDPVELRKVGIDPLHELTGVGRNLQDHIVLGLVYDTRRPEFSYPHCDWKTINCDWTDRMRAQLEVNNKGLVGASSIGVTHFLRTNDGVATANMQYVVSNLRAEVTADGAVHWKPGMMPVLHSQRPISCGHLTLRSRNPSDDPIIELNYFTDPSEIREFIECIAAVRKVFAQPALAEYVGEELNPGPAVSSNASIEQFTRENVRTGCHWSGTCRMGDPDAAPTPEAARKLVVDAELRVCGLRGLRVVDASVMPSITSGNIMAPILMIAERAADFISSAYLMEAPN